MYSIRLLLATGNLRDYSFLTHYQSYNFPYFSDKREKFKSADREKKEMFLVISNALSINCSDMSNNPLKQLPLRIFMTSFWLEKL